LLLEDSVIFVNENENENGVKRENNKFINENWNEHEEWHTYIQVLLVYGSQRLD